MAVYTEVPDGELAAFLDLYNLGHALSCKGIAEGVENSNYLLQTTSGNFILTLYEKRVAPEDLPFFLTLMEHLAAHGLNCPQPVKSRTGALLGFVAGGAAPPPAVLLCTWGPPPRARRACAVCAGLAALDAS